MSFNALPDVVILSIFKNFSIQELAKVSSVCKRWNNFVKQSDFLWKQFIPKCEHVGPGEGLLTVKSMWYRGVEIGEERWYPNPLNELVNYERRLRKAEYHHFWRNNSKTTLYWRLNPRYKLTTKGNDVQDAKMNEVCRDIWDEFKGRSEEPAVRITSHKAAMKDASFRSRYGVMERLLDELEPSWFLDGLDLEPRELDAECNIVNIDANEDDEEVFADDLGDESSDEIFGPLDALSYDSNAWKSKVNKRLPVHLYRKLKSVFADGSDNFIVYPLNDGTWNENLAHAYTLLISDTAAFYIERYYEL